MENIFENFSCAVLKINRTMQKIKHFEMKVYDLQTIHVMCVYYLNKSEKGLTPSELVNCTLEDKAAISRAVKTLKEKGLATSEGDGYKCAITLTNKGAEVAKHIEERSIKAVENASLEFSDKEREFFYNALFCIADKLQKYYENMTKENCDND